MADDKNQNGVTSRAASRTSRAAKAASRVVRVVKAASRAARAVKAASRTSRTRTRTSKGGGQQGGQERKQDQRYIIAEIRNEQRCPPRRCSLPFSASAS